MNYLKPVLLAGTVIPVLSVATAFAQAPAPVYQWTGFYIGANAGYVSSRGSFDETPDSQGWWENSGSATAGGVIGGFQAGYNWQSGSFVYGLEVDASLSSANKSRDVGLSGGSFKVGLDGMASVRGRIGFAADRSLIYATAGAAYGAFDTGIHDPGPSIDTSRGSSWGWIAGGGFENAFANNWTARFEVLFAQFGNDTIRSNDYAFRVKDSATIARFAINYRY